MEYTRYILVYFKNETSKGTSNCKEYKTLTGAYKAALKMIKGNDDFVTIREEIHFNGGMISGIIETVKAA